LLDEIVQQIYAAPTSERKVLLSGCWWLVCSETKVLLAGG
jgi:hypothetical protein